MNRALTNRADDGRSGFVGGTQHRRVQERGRSPAVQVGTASSLTIGFGNHEARSRENLAAEVRRMKGDAPDGLVHPPQFRNGERLGNEAGGTVVYSSLARTRSIASFRIVS